MLEGGPAGYDAEPMLGIGRLRIQIEIRAICKKNHLQLQDDCGAFNFEMPQYKDRYDGIIWMGYVGIHARMQYRSLKPGNTNDS